MELQTERQQEVGLKKVINGFIKHSKQDKNKIQKRSQIIGTVQVMNAQH